MESPLQVHATTTPATLPARPPDPCTLVLFGATGDLAQRKIAPALYNLARCGELPSTFSLLGTSTSVGEAEAYRQRLRESVSRFSRTQPLDAEVWGRFAPAIRSAAADINSPADWSSLREAVLAVERERGTRGNRLFYLAVPPASFGPILTGLRDSGLVHPPHGAPWSRVVIEKPFGRDLDSARELHRLVAGVHLGQRLSHV